jgi:catechol 2,3-dioxygenase-like lactoylglutathione lyase family enzyme
VLDDVGAITMFVADPQRSKEFYERVFDVPVAFEDANSAAFDFKHIIVNLLNVSEAPGLIGPAEVATSGSRMQLTIWVDDTDAVVARLAENGVKLLNGPIDRPWGVRTAAFADPDGHVWEVGQQLR